MRIATTPGEVLREEYLIPNKLTVGKLAKMLDVSIGTVSRLLNGKIGISTEMALRLGKVFGTTAMFWINLQIHHDISVARADIDLQADIDSLEPYFKPTVTENREDAEIDC